MPGADEKKEEDAVAIPTAYAEEPAKGRKKGGKKRMGRIRA
jgi:hypothetical protein